jgi:hypothetical protein
VLPETENGVYLTIESRPNEPLLTERLERRSKKIELLPVRQEGNLTTATVFVPQTAKDFFEKTVEDYRTKDEPRANEPEAKHRRLVEGIGEIRLGALRDLWVDAPNRFPEQNQLISWEVWLRRETSDNACGESNRNRHLVNGANAGDRIAGIRTQRADNRQRSNISSKAVQLSHSSKLSGKA